MSATKFTVLIEDGKNVVQRPKFNIVSTPVKKTVTLNASEFVPYSSLATNTLLSGSSTSLHELGKHLLKAAASGNSEELKGLLSKGAPFTADWLGTSPLHLSAQNNHLEVTEMLLRAGISKDARTKVDRTPLHMAAYEGHIQIVDSLIKHGADIDCRDLLGMTPLQWATQNGHKDVVEYLIGKGANVSITNKFELTALDISKQISRTDISDTLEGALFNTELATQNLVIQLAQDEIQNNGEENSQVLTSEDVDMVDGDDQTPIIIPLEPHLINQLQQQTEDINAHNIDEDMQFEEDNSNLTSNLTEPQVEIHEEPLVHSITIDPENFNDSLKLLQEHGITLQNENDDSNILNTVMESGHSVVLTDVGKEVLNSVKEAEHQQHMKEKKIFTITPDGFLKMSNEPVQKPVQKPIKIRRIMMKKSKCTPLATVVNVVNENKPHNVAEHVSVSDMECIMKELIEARQTIEEYKVKLHKKEQEAEKYKMQLKLFMDAS